MDKKQPYAVSQSLYTAVLPDKTAVLLDALTGQFFRLNTVAHTMWELIQDGKTFQEVSQEIVHRYTITPDVVSGDLEGLITTLKEHHLLSEEDGSCPVTTPQHAPSWYNRRAYPRFLECVEAFFTVRHVQILLAEQSLSQAARSVAALPASRHLSANHPDVIRLRHVIRQAARLQRFPAQCLHQSFALAMMLRRRRFLADVVIGVYTHPFTSHAWVQSGQDIIVILQHIVAKSSTICFIKRAAQYASQRRFELRWETSHHMSWLVKSVHAKAAPSSPIF